MNLAKNLRSTIIVLVLLFTSPAFAKAAVHTVNSGESLFLIAQQYNISTSEIKSANALSSNNIFPGQRLWIPENQSSTGSTGSTYRVQSGDSLFLIARRFNLSVQDLKRLNGLSSDTIQIGQTLRLSGGQAQNASRGGYTRGITREDANLLAHLVYSEARGEPYSGQVAVAAVALNRVRDQNFPNTVKEVIFEPWAFTAINDGQFWLTPDATAYRAVEDAMAGWDPSGGALYYWNPITATNRWVWSRPIIATIGNHVFAL